MVEVLEAAKLVTCAWLARHWRVTPLLAARTAHRCGAGADDAESHRQLRC
jgi:hypothetical protein